MKNAILISALLLMSCNQKETTSEASTTDSTSIAETADTEKLPAPDSGVVVIPEQTPKVSPTFRTVENGKITKTINADMIPLTLTDEFTAENHELILKIKNFDRPKIFGAISPENPKMNIRFNQIRLPDGSLDGPFGREITYEIPQKGEIWLLIGKSNMASGEITGEFSVSLR
ncbi:hypothetical protein SAMN05421638_1646 [Kaistella treverensis]|uniref:Lipoprotein n=1 Tax=Kaistella treverensis TaxID=631455 RepID=A0A1I3MBP1_9FLAO|nr:hypothetical protein [Kaistella treverensis]SFI94312.1 hypothetical protein SAMN05421638_1646 [Kaistella treverensis]